MASTTHARGNSLPTSSQPTLDIKYEKELSSGQLVGEPKPGTVIDITSLDSPGGHAKSPTVSAQESRPWRPSFLRVRPLSGLIAIAIIICCMFANLGILFGSNHAPTESWRYQPSTYLAIMTAISNLALRYASFQGFVIAWWHRASAGSTIKRLQQDWQAGTHFLAALAAGRHMGFVGLACIFAALGTIDGPLLQRATTVVSRPYVDTPVQLTTSLVSELPTGLSGSWAISPNGYVTTMFHKQVPTSFGNVSNNVVSSDSDYFEMNLRLDYMKDPPITGGVAGCDGTCRLKVHAPALAVNACTSYHLPVNYTLPPPPLDGKAIPLDRKGFLTYINLLIDEDQGRERINVVSGYSQTTECAGILNYTACTLDSAIGEYTVTIRDGQITLDPGSPTIVAIANNTAVNHTKVSTGGINAIMAHNSTLAGIVDLAVAKWTSESGFLGGGFMVVQGFPGEQYQLPSYSSCTQWTDPLPDMLQDMNTLMFRAGIYVASAFSSSALQQQLDLKPNLNATVTGQQVGSHNVFSTNFYFFLAAAILQLFCISLVLPTYWGWWRLGRSVSFSPFEIAKAFDAPLLNSCNVNSTGRDVAIALGGLHIQYGFVDNMQSNSAPSLRSSSETGDGEPEKTVMFAESQHVHRLAKATRL